MQSILLYTNFILRMDGNAYASAHGLFRAAPLIRDVSRFFWSLSDLSYLQSSLNRLER